MNAQIVESQRSTPSTQMTFTGKLVRLTALDPEQDAKVFARFAQDSEYQQLMDSGPAKLFTPSQMKEWIEKHLDDVYFFSIRSLVDDSVIGEIDLAGIDWVAGSCWVGIGIGDRDYWGKGYGTEAMNLAAGFAFNSLNLRRINLNVFEYNTRAHQSYIKVGFKDEGRFRKWMQRGGERYDLIFMGLLREEWEEKQKEQLLR